MVQRIPDSVPTTPSSVEEGSHFHDNARVRRWMFMDQTVQSVRLSGLSPSRKELQHPGASACS